MYIVATRYYIIQYCIYYQNLAQLRNDNFAMITSSNPAVSLCISDL